jgi:hypothetical protein
MAFEPFGYRFEVCSALSPDAAKAAIRSRKRGLFDSRGGARGWIAGSIICLQSDNSRNPPMIIARISQSDLGTKIKGWAGYLGSVGLIGLVPVLAYGAWLIFSDPNMDHAPAYLLFEAFVVAIMSLVLWMNHRSRHDADPLVCFLRDAVGKPDQLRKTRSALPKLAAKFPKSLTLEIGGSVLNDPATPTSVRDALLDLEGDGFVILSSAEESYIQTIEKLGRYIVEKREGDDLHFYRAVRRETEPSDDPETFTYEEALAVFFAYGSNSPMPSFLEWKTARP